MADLPTPPYTEATVDLVAEATEQHHIVDGQTDAMGNSPCVCGQWWDAPGDNPGWDQHMAEVALNALVRAGLLLPEGAETRTEWRPGASVNAVEFAAKTMGHSAGCPCYRCRDLRAGFRSGVAAGRAQAAADIRARADDEAQRAGFGVHGHDGCCARPAPPNDVMDAQQGKDSPEV